MKLEQLKNKKILILGFGKEGRDTLRFLKELNLTKHIGIADQKELQGIPKGKRIKYYLGKNYLKSVSYYDIIIKSPGIPYKLIYPLIKKGSTLTSQTEIFLDNFKGQTIGITGTKGKSTTTSLIYNILKKSGLNVHLVGNIGKPVLTSLIKAKANDIFVYELSCHQLNQLNKSPHIAIFLDIFPEHLDYYDNFTEYFKAKQNICLHQKKNDYFIFDSDFKLLRDLSKRVKSHSLSFGFKPYKNIKAFLKNNWIYYEKEKIISSKDIPLLGKHNLANVMASIIVAKIFHCSNKDIKEAILEFKPLNHRLQFVGTFHNILFYNDSLSTIPQATIAAIKALGPNNIDTLMLGGYDRGINFSPLIKEIIKLHLKAIILFPPSGERIYKSILKQWPSYREDKPKLFLVNNMKEAVNLCYTYTSKNKICLLSTASASFGLFNNYRDRGEQFVKYVKEIGKAKEKGIIMERNKKE